MNPEILRLINEAADHLYTTQDMIRVRELAREVRAELRSTSPNDVHLADLVLG